MSDFSLEKARKRNPQAGEQDYGLSIRSGVRGLWRGNLDIYGFIDSMFSSIRRGFTRAWLEGMETCGIMPGDMTTEEQRVLEFEINSELQYVVSYANAIDAESRATGGKLSPQVFRSDMWTNRYGYIRDLARTYACGDQKLQWIINAICKEHCNTCLLLAGRVYRASVWRANNISPRDHKLACGGFRCCCEFVTTNLPVTPGPFPRLL